jgi:cellulose biosynthesis protein BcsQ
MSRIVTFYSYKGGVGRTAALANIGVLLARRGKRVLMVDCDLEAPGLDRYFHSYVSHPQPSNRGMIHLLHEAALSPLAEWGGHRITVTLPPLSKTETEPVTLDLISSGSYATDYADRVRRFSWDRFFENESGGSNSRSLAR